MLRLALPMLPDLLTDEGETLPEIKGEANNVGTSSGAEGRRVMPVFEATLVRCCRLALWFGSVRVADVDDPGVLAAEADAGVLGSRQRFCPSTIDCKGVGFDIAMGAGVAGSLPGLGT